jgi:CubicO group peptidase (beta-lactamase class C family)
MLQKVLYALILLSSVSCFSCMNRAIAHSKETCWEWPTSTLRDEGVDENKFKEALKYIEQSVKNIRSMVIIRHGKLVCEKYYKILNKDTTYSIASTTKSVISALVGIALKENLIKGGLDAKGLDFFPEINFDNITEDKKFMTIKDLLTMRSGLQWDDNVDAIYNKKNPVKFVLGKPMESAPGVKWRYNSGTAHVLSIILTRVTGMTTYRFALEKLFGPLGIKDFSWDVDRDGVAMGGYGLNMKPKDLAKIGLLYLHNGVWNNTEILSANWVKTSTDSITRTDWTTCGQYGYLWWNLDLIKGYCTRGLYGQDMYVIPDKDLIIVFTSEFEVIEAATELNKIVKNHILPAMN